MSLSWNAENGEKEIVSNEQAIHFITAMQQVMANTYLKSDLVLTFTLTS